MLNQSNFPPEPINLSPLVQRQMREKEIKEHKKLDNSWGIKQDEITDANLLLEINIRYVQYVSQFQIFSTGYKIFQCLSDFHPFMVVMQKRKKKLEVNYNLPVAKMNDGKFIYANRSSNLGIFALEKEK